MKLTPFDQTMNDLFARLQDAVTQREEANVTITANTAAIRALASTCEDGNAKTSYLVRLDEIIGKTGFKDVILSVLSGRGPMTPTEIRSWILISKKMDLSGYSNPLASIHTTLRRMVGNEVEECLNTKGEKAYRLRLKTVDQFKAEADALLDNLNRDQAQFLKSMYDKSPEPPKK